MTVVFSAVLLSCIKIITSDEITVRHDNNCGDESVKCELETTTEEFIEVNRHFDSREWFHYTTVTYPRAMLGIARQEKKPRPHPAEGPFFNFTLDFYDTILNKLKPRKAAEVLRMIGKHLRGSASRRRSCESFLKHFVNRLAKKSKLLSRQKASQIKEKITGLMNDTLEEKPRRIELFQAINSLFAWRYDVKLRAYIYYLRGYGRHLEKKRLIDRQTKLLFRNGIFYLLDKQVDSVRNEVIMKLMLAYEEYYR